MFRKYCWILVVGTLLLTGCAHSIIVSPNITPLSTSSELNKNKKYNIGYFISLKDSDLEVTTLGGGGDNVKYYPYRDIEDGYRAMLSSVFNAVTKLSAVNDTNSISKNNIDFIIAPVLVTSSGGAGLFTWPPTNFTVDLTSNVKNSEGLHIAGPRVVGTGVASTSERL